MADFLNKLKKNIDKGAKVITAKSNSAIETQKVKSELNALKKSKAEAFSSIGKKVYEATQEGAFDLDLVADEISSLKELDAALADKELEIEKIKMDTEAKLDEIQSQDVDIVDVEAEEVEEEYEEVDLEEVVEDKDVELQETDEEQEK